MRNAAERLRNQSRWIQVRGPPSLLLGIGDCSPDGVLGGNASFGESIISRIKILAILAYERRLLTHIDSGVICIHTFCIFVKIFLCVGSLPYRRKSFCSSSVSFYSRRRQRREP